MKLAVLATIVPAKFPPVTRELVAVIVVPVMVLPVMALPEIPSDHQVVPSEITVTFPYWLLTTEEPLTVETVRVWLVLSILINV